MDEFFWETPSEINKNLAKRVKNIRKRKKLTQIQLAERSNVSYGALKKFEQTGEISLLSLTKISLELGIADEIKELFTQVPYRDIQEVVNEAKNT
ncbi:MAG: helix-turn-helix transcriptional regulator [Lachnospiraceae bacterium]|nr:helix-turn-helix transcriptional regulator [Lachnospiraceae bacterium]